MNSYTFYTSPYDFMTCTGCWWGSLRERNHWGDQDLDGRIILKLTLKKGIYILKLILIYNIKTDLKETHIYIYIYGKIILKLILKKRRAGLLLALSITALSQAPHF